VTRGKVIDNTIIKSIRQFLNCTMILQNLIQIKFKILDFESEILKAPQYKKRFFDQG
jgi:hypothetical protein